MMQYDFYKNVNVILNDAVNNDFYQNINVILNDAV